jgi:hypothetical protein
MNEPKHFSYEGKAHLKGGKQVVDSVEPQKVVGVEFLTPARITVSHNGKEITETVNVDIINRKVYLASGSEWMSDELFHYLDSVNNLPEDFFAAPDELHEKVASLEEDRLRQQEDILGDQQ